MTKKDFQRNMYNAKRLLGSNTLPYACWALELSFSKKIRYRSNLGVVCCYKSIINGNNCSDYGMFGATDNQANQDARMLSLDIFEQIMIDEKRYKEL